MRAQIGSHALERLLNSLLQVQGVQTVEKKKAPDDIVTGTRFQEITAYLARVGHMLQDPFQPDFMQLQNGLYDLTSV